LFHARPLSWNRRHQHRRRICRRAARNANANALQRQIALTKIPAAAEINLHIALQNRRLKSQNVLTNSPHAG
jgi:hypothetical protein